LSAQPLPGLLHIPAYITSHAVIDINSRNISEANLTSGRIHRINCSGNQQLAIANNAFLQNVVIVTNCRTSFGNGARMENAILATSHIGDKSINGPNGVQIGRNDNCGTGGGAQLITMGSMDFASGLKVFGGQLLARNNILFTADGGGIQGASFVAGNAVQGTSNMSMEGCGGRGMEGNFREMYARLVQ